MRPFVIVATKNRAKATVILMDFLQRQTLQADQVVIVGTEPSDIEDCANHPLVQAGNAKILISPRMGSTSQRNYGLDFLEEHGFFSKDKGAFFCIFFDDDFRMADDWLACAQARFLKGGIVGLTGWTLGDGVKKGGLSEESALLLLTGALPPEKHWASGTEERDLDSVYGCNMAFTDRVIRSQRFDENTPLYAWLEDRDFTGNAKKIGRVIYYPYCRGVHLGAPSGGRTSGVKFGYSQIINPLYFHKKGTMSIAWTAKFVSRALASNVLHTLINKKTVDYRGRLWGNALAIIDICRGRLDPKRIISL